VNFRSDTNLKLSTRWDRWSACRFPQ